MLAPSRRFIWLHSNNISTVTDGEKIVKFNRSHSTISPPSSHTPLSQVLTSSDTLRSCSLSKKSVSHTTNDIVRLSGLNASLYLGSFLEGDSIINGQFSHYELPNSATRNNINVYIDNIPGTTPQQNIKPIPDEINIARHNIIDGQDVQSFNWFYSSQTVSTKSEAEASLGFAIAADVPAEIMAAIAQFPVGLGASGSINYSATVDFEKTCFVISSILKGYTVGIGGISHPKELYTPSDAPISKDAVYVSSITYGRRIYIIAETFELNVEFEVRLKKAIKALIENIGLSSTEKLYLNSQFSHNETRVKIFVIGASSAPPSRLINNMNELDEVVSEIGNSERAETMAPISYRLSFLDGSGFASINILSESIVPQCRTVKELYTVKIKSITATQVVDFGGDEEIYGNISVEAIYGNNINIESTGGSRYLFDESSSNFQKIREDESITINKSRTFKIPIDHIDTVKFIIKTDLKDHVVKNVWDDLESLGTSETSISYKGSAEISLRDVINDQHETSFICTEVQGNAKLKISFSIEPA